MLSRDTAREAKAANNPVATSPADGVTTGKNGANTALVANLSVSGIGGGLAQHLYDVTPQQIAQSSGGRRRNRRRRQAAEEGAPIPPSIPAERPPLVPLLLIGSALIVLPIVVATARVRAVEVVRG